MNGFYSKASIGELQRLEQYELDLAARGKDISGMIRSLGGSGQDRGDRGDNSKRDIGVVGLGNSEPAVFDFSSQQSCFPAPSSSASFARLIGGGNKGGIDNNNNTNDRIYDINNNNSLKLKELDHIRELRQKNLHDRLEFSASNSKYMAEISTFQDIAFRREHRHSTKRTSDNQFVSKHFKQFLLYSNLSFLQRDYLRMATKHFMRRYFAIFCEHMNIYRRRALKPDNKSSPRYQQQLGQHQHDQYEYHRSNSDSTGRSIVDIGSSQTPQPPPAVIYDDAVLIIINILRRVLNKFRKNVQKKYVSCINDLDNETKMHIFTLRRTLKYLHKRTRSQRLIVRVVASNYFKSNLYSKFFVNLRGEVSASRRNILFDKSNYKSQCFRVLKMFARNHDASRQYLLGCYLGRHIRIKHVFKSWRKITIIRCYLKPKYVASNNWRFENSFLLFRRNLSDLKKNRALSTKFDLFADNKYSKRMKRRFFNRLFKSIAAKKERLSIRFHQKRYLKRMKSCFIKCLIKSVRDRKKSVRFYSKFFVRNLKRKFLERLVESVGQKRKLKKFEGSQKLARFYRKLSVRRLSGALKLLAITVKRRHLRLRMVCDDARIKLKYWLEKAKLRPQVQQLVTTADFHHRKKLFQTLISSLKALRVSYLIKHKARLNDSVLFCKSRIRRYFDHWLNSCCIKTAADVRAISLPHHRKYMLKRSIQFWQKFKNKKLSKFLLDKKSAVVINSRRKLFIEYIRIRLGEFSKRHMKLYYKVKKCTIVMRKQRLTSYFDAWANRVTSLKSMEALRVSGRQFQFDRSMAKYVSKWFGYVKFRADIKVKTDFVKLASVHMEKYFLQWINLTDTRFELKHSLLKSCIYRDKVRLVKSLAKLGRLVIRSRRVATLVETFHDNKVIKLTRFHSCISKLRMFVERQKRFCKPDIWGQFNLKRSFSKMRKYVLKTKLVQKAFDEKSVKCLRKTLLKKYVKVWTKNYLRIESVYVNKKLRIEMKKKDLRGYTALFNAFSKNFVRQRTFSSEAVSYAKNKSHSLGMQFFKRFAKKSAKAERKLAYGDEINISKLQDRGLQGLMQYRKKLSEYRARKTIARNKRKHFLLQSIFKGLKLYHELELKILKTSVEFLRKIYVKRFKGAIAARLKLSSYYRMLFTKSKKKSIYMKHLFSRWRRRILFKKTCQVNGNRASLEHKRFHLKGALSLLHDSWNESKCEQQAIDLGQRHASLSLQKKIFAEWYRDFSHRKSMNIVAVDSNGSKLAVAAVGSPNRKASYRRSSIINMVNKVSPKIKNINKKEFAAKKCALKLMLRGCRQLISNMKQHAVMKDNMRSALMARDYLLQKTSLESFVNFFNNAKADRAFESKISNRYTSNLKSLCLQNLLLNAKKTRNSMNIELGANNWRVSRFIKRWSSKSLFIKVKTPVVSFKPRATRRRSSVILSPASLGSSNLNSMNSVWFADTLSDVASDFGGSVMSENWQRPLVSTATKLKSRRFQVENDEAADRHCVKYSLKRVFRYLRILRSTGLNRRGILVKFSTFLKRKYLQLFRSEVVAIKVVKLREASKMTKANNNIKHKALMFLKYLSKLRQRSDIVKKIKKRKVFSLWTLKMSNRTLMKKIINSMWRTFTTDKIEISFLAWKDFAYLEQRLVDFAEEKNYRMKRSVFKYLAKNRRNFLKNYARLDRGVYFRDRFGFCKFFARMARIQDLRSERYSLSEVAGQHHKLFRCRKLFAKLRRCLINRSAKMMFRNSLRRSLFDAFFSRCSLIINFMKPRMRAGIHLYLRKALSLWCKNRMYYYQARSYNGFNQIVMKGGKRRWFISGKMYRQKMAKCASYYIDRLKRQFFKKLAKMRRDNLKSYTKIDLSIVHLEEWIKRIAIRRFKALRSRRIKRNLNNQKIDDVHSQRSVDTAFKQWTRLIAIKFVENQSSRLIDESNRRRALSRVLVLLKSK